MPTRQTSLAYRVGSRRPPRLNVDAVREAEARGSLTSLPDLIRRATRLAANLGPWTDGKQTWNGLFLILKRPKVNMTGDLGRYPIFSPHFHRLVLQRPQVITRQQDEYRGGRLALRLRECASMQETEHSKSQGRGRRCCGMPLWGFIILLIVLLLLVAAAVVVPIVLMFFRKYGTNTMRQLPQLLKLVSVLRPSRARMVALPL